LKVKSNLNGCRLSDQICTHYWTCSA